MRDVLAHRRHAAHRLSIANRGTAAVTGLDVLNLALSSYSFFTYETDFAATMARSGSRASADCMNSFSPSNS